MPILTAPRGLYEAIQAFDAVCLCGFIYDLTGPDLVDTLASRPRGQLPAYDPAVYGPLLDYLADPEWRSGTGGYDPDRVTKLRQLEIYPTSAGGRVSLLGEVFIPGNFDPPAVAATVTLLCTGEGARWVTFLRSLQVPTLTRPRFIEDHLLPGYEYLSPADQLQALQWLRDNLDAGRTEYEQDGDDPADLLDLVKEANLILADCGESFPAVELYDPESDVVADLLGDQARFPDMAQYAKGKDRWFAFFRSLGMLDRPLARDLLGRIDRLVADTRNNLTSRISNQLLALFRHIDARWRELADAAVMDSAGRTFREALKTRAWLPAECRPSNLPPLGGGRGAGRAALPGGGNFTRPSTRTWSRGSGRSFRSRGCGSRCIRHSASPVPCRPTWSSITLSGWLTFGHRASGRISRVMEETLRRIYTFISSDCGAEDEDAIRDRFSGKKCLWHDADLWEPARLSE